MFKPIKIILKLQGALALGVIVAGAFFQEDVWLKERIEQMICQACTECIGKPFSLQITKVDLLNGEIEARNIECSNEKWSFKSPSARIRFSWLSRLKNPGFEAELIFYKPVIYTKYEQRTFAIADPLMALIYAPTQVPLILKQCRLQQAQVVVDHDYGTLNAHCSSVTDIKPQAVTTSLTWHDGSLNLKDDYSVKNLSGSLTVDVPTATPENYSLQFHLLGDMQKSRMIFLGSYKDNQATFDCYPEDRTFSFRSHRITFEPEAVTGEVELSGNVNGIARFIPQLAGLSGTALFKGRVTFDSAVNYTGTFAFKDVHYLLPCVNGIVDGTLNKAQGTLNVESIKGIEVGGTWKYGNKMFEGSLALKKPISLASVDASSLTSLLTYKEGKLKALNTIKGMIAGVKFVSRSTVESNRDELRLKGVLNEAFYSAKISLTSGELLQASYSDKQTAKRLSLKKTDRGVEGTIHFDLLKELVKLLTGTQIYGLSNGYAELIMNVKDGVITTFVRAKDTALKIPSLYNFITSLSGLVEYDYNQGCVKVKELLIDFHKGNVYCPCATFYLNKNGALRYAHIPLTGRSLFISSSKDFFATVSGQVTALYEKHWSCMGSIILDKAQLNNNLLSSNVQKNLLTTTWPWMEHCSLDLSIETAAPIEVKSPFFQTQAHTSMRVSGMLAQPKVQGSVDLLEGLFAFPYKPLYIIKGKLRLSGQQGEDPSIELLARNTIKKYTVTLTVNGTLNHPKITFDASPQLTQEQIITLLLTGTPESSLYLAMPSIVMMHMESLLFGSGEHLSKAQQFFKNILKHVSFVPTQTDKGVRGAIEVNFSDRLRAKAQNALDLSDETQLELEYSLSDDMRIKAVRDDKGALGGELEMTWKF